MASDQLTNLGLSLLSGEWSMQNFAVTGLSPAFRVKAWAAGRDPA